MKATCPYLKGDIVKLEEVCIITGKAMSGDIICDFEYLQCPSYNEAQKPIKPKKREAVQITLFGEGV